MRPVVAFSLVLLLTAGCVQAQEPAGGATSVEIADGRAERVLSGGSEADLSAWEDHAAVRRAMAAARVHWQARDADYEEDARVLAVAEGAFTTPGADQHAVLYLMSLWPRCCPKLGLAVIEGDRAVRNVAFEAVAQDLAAVPDLDGDGLDELATSGIFGMGGSVSGGVTLLAFTPAGVRTWGSAPILEDACAAMRDGSTAWRVLAGPGPSFVTERYTQPSCESATWEPAGDAEPLELDLYEEDYVEIALE